MPQGLSIAHFEAVLFDVDGTLVDSLEMIVPGLADAIERYAGVRPSNDEIQSLVGMPLRAQFERYLPTSPTNDQLCEMTEFTLSRFEAYVSRENIFLPAVNALRLCKSMGIRTALVTSKTAAELALFIARFPGTDAVDTVVCASDVEHPKPAPDSALLAMSRLKVRSKNAVFIGDSIYDMRCARDAGIASVAVGYGAATRDTLLAEDPDIYFDTPDALFAWVNESFLNRHAPQENYNRRFIDNNAERAPGAA